MLNDTFSHRKNRLFLTVFLAIGASGFAQPATPAATPAAAAKEKPAATAKTPYPTPVPSTDDVFKGMDQIQYREGSGRKLLLYVAKPKGWAATDKRPVLIFFFGGGYTHGGPENSVGWAKWAAKQGMVGVAPDYRTALNALGSTPLDSVSDGRDAVRWVQDHAATLGIDPARIAVGGSSAGAHLALWCGLDPGPPGGKPEESPSPRPAALVLLSAPSDTSRETGYGGSRMGTSEQALAGSPFHHLDAKLPPVLFFHGDADQTVPYKQSVELDKKLTELNVEHIFVPVPGGSHGFSSDLPEWKDKSRAMILDFLTKHKLTEPAAGPEKKSEKSADKKKEDG